MLYLPLGNTKLLSIISIISRNKKGCQIALFAVGSPIPPILTLKQNTVLTPVYKFCKDLKEFVNPVSLPPQQGFDTIEGDPPRIPFQGSG